MTSHQNTLESADALTNRHERVLDEAARQLNEKGVLLTSLAEPLQRILRTAPFAHPCAAEVARSAGEGARTARSDLTANR